MVLRLSWHVNEDTDQKSQLWSLPADWNRGTYADQGMDQGCPLEMSWQRVQRWVACGLTAASATGGRDSASCSFFDEVTRSYDRDGANGLLHIQVCICHQPAHLPTKETVQYSCQSGSCTRIHYTATREAQPGSKAANTMLQFHSRKIHADGLLAYMVWYRQLDGTLLGTSGENCSDFLCICLPCISLKSFWKFHTASVLVSIFSWALDSYTILRLHHSMQLLTLNWQGGSSLKCLMK